MASVLIRLRTYHECMTRSIGSSRVYSLLGRVTFQRRAVNVECLSFDCDTGMRAIKSF